MVSIRSLLVPLLVLVGCASPSRVGPIDRAEKIFELPPLDLCTVPPTLSDVETRVSELDPSIGRWPPRFRDEADRESVYARWSEARACAEALSADRDPEMRWFLLSELYRLGHNMDVVGADAKAAENLAACLGAFPRSALCNLSASYFYLSVKPKPEFLAIAERSLSVLRDLARPGFSEEAEAGFVFLYIYRQDPAATRSQIEHFLVLFPDTARAADFRTIRDHLGDEIPIREY